MAAITPTLDETYSSEHTRVFYGTLATGTSDTMLVNCDGASHVTIFSDVTGVTVHPISRAGSFANVPGSGGRWLAPTATAAGYALNPTRQVGLTVGGSNADVEVHVHYGYTPPGLRSPN